MIDGGLDLAYSIDGPDFGDPAWTNRVTLFKNIEVDYLLRAARHTP